MIEESQVVVHKADEPDSIAEFLNPDVLSGEHCAEIDLKVPETNAAALGDGDGSVVERVVQLVEPVIRAR